MRRDVLAWGAQNSVPSGSKQATKLQLDYAGGWGKYRRVGYASTFRNACGPYRGPRLPWFLLGCTAPDGTHWTLQSWQRMLPNLGHPPWTAEQKAWELRLAHFSGELPELEIWLDWSYSVHFHHLLGRFTYFGEPVYGYSASPTGAPKDGFGRNIYFDTFDSAYGAGWRRENSFLTHRGTGVFCYGFYPHDPYPGYPPGRRPPGHGTKYRATVIGPGVTPDVLWTSPGLPDYDPSDTEHVALEQEMNTLQRSLAARDCRQN